MKILLIRFSSIGDIVLVSPLLRCLRAQQPDVEIHFLTKSEFRAVVVHNPEIDKVHFLEEDLDKTIDDLKKENYDYIADLHNNLRTLRVKQALKVKETYSFPKLNIQKWILVNLRIKSVMPDKSIVERYFETLKPLGIRNDGLGLSYIIPSQSQTGQNDIPTSHWTGYVAAVIGGSYKTKKYPIEKWREFCEKVPFPVMLLGGPDDREEGQAIADLDPIKIYNSCGKFNLNESADLVRRSRVVVSNDTGLMHIAAAFQKPIVSLWGNTSPELGMFPYYGGNNLGDRVSPLSIIMEKEKLGCHPCSKLGYERCPRGHFNCMMKLDVDKIVENVKFFWKAAQPVR